MAQTIKIETEANAPTHGHIRAKRAFVAKNSWRQPSKDLTVLHAGESKTLPADSHIAIFTGRRVYDIHTTSKATITGPVAFTLTQDTTTTPFQRWKADVESVDSMTGFLAMPVFTISVFALLHLMLSENAGSILFFLSLFSLSGLASAWLYRSAGAIKRTDLHVAFEHKALKDKFGGIKFKPFLSPRSAPQATPLDAPVALDDHTRLYGQTAPAQTTDA